MIASADNLFGMDSTRTDRVDSFPARRSKGASARGLMFDRLESRRLLTFTGLLPATLTGVGYESVDEIVARPDGSFIAGGLFFDTIINSNLIEPIIGGPRRFVARGDSDIWLGGFDRDGVVDWLITFGGDADEIKGGRSRADFATRPLRASEPFIFGVSARNYGMGESITDIEFAPDGTIYIAGIFKGSFRFNQGDVDQTFRAQGTGEFYDSFILKLSPDGGPIDAFTIGGPFNDIIYDIEIDAAGDLYTAGYFSRQADLQPGRARQVFNPLGRADAFVARYSTNDKLVWLAPFGSDVARGELLEAAYAIDIAANGDIAVGGAFAGVADLDPGRFVRTFDAGGEGTDAFTAVLSPRGKIVNLLAQGSIDRFEGIRDVAWNASGTRLYTVGYFQRDADLGVRTGPGVSSSPVELEEAGDEPGDRGNKTDLFLTDFGPNGARVQQLPGSGYEAVTSLDVDPTSGDVVLTGSFYGNLDLTLQRGGISRFLSSPESGLNDRNQRDRGFAYSSFVARYSANLRLKSDEQIDGRFEYDVFTHAAALRADGSILLGGRFLAGFTVGSTTVDITNRPDGGEDAWLLVV